MMLSDDLVFVSSLAANAQRRAKTRTTRRCTRRPRARCAACARCSPPPSSSCARRAPPSPGSLKWYDTDNLYTSLDTPCHIRRNWASVTMLTRRFWFRRPYDIFLHPLPVSYVILKRSHTDLHIKKNLR